VASTHQPSDISNSKIAFLELTRRIREDQGGGIQPLNDALGKGIRLILAHRVPKERVESESRRVLHLAAERLRAVEFEPDSVPQMIVSLIHQCCAEQPPAKRPVREFAPVERDAVA